MTEPFGEQGYNAYGQLGDGTNIDQGTAVQVLNITNANSIAVSDYYHSLIATNDNKFYAFGANSGGFGNGSIENSNIPVLIMEDCILLSTENIEANAFTFYPNPSSGILNISSDKLNDVSIEIYDFNGRIVFSEKNFNTQKVIDIQHLQSGMYLVKLIADDVQFVQKIIKY